MNVFQCSWLHCRSHGFISGIYADIVVLLYMKKYCTCGLYMAFEGILASGTFITITCFLPHDGGLYYQWQNCISLVGMIVWKYFMTLLVLEWCWHKVSCTIDCAIGIIWYLMSMGSHYQKSPVAHYISNLDLRNAVMLLIAPSASHDKKGHDAPCFDCFDLRNAMVPLMLLASWDANASASGITWPKSHVSPHFDHLDLRMQWCHWQCLLIPTIVNSIVITWPKVTFYLILIVINYGMNWCHWIHFLH